MGGGLKGDTVMIWIATMCACILDDRGVKVASCPFATRRAQSEEEALGIAIKAACEKWPESDGWYGHQANVALLPDEFVRNAMASPIDEVAQ